MVRGRRLAGKWDLPLPQSDCTLLLFLSRLEKKYRATFTRMCRLTSPRRTCFTSRPSSSQGVRNDQAFASLNLDLSLFHLSHCIPSRVVPTHAQWILGRQSFCDLYNPHKKPSVMVVRESLTLNGTPTPPLSECQSILWNLSVPSPMFAFSSSCLVRSADPFSASLYTGNCSNGNGRQQKRLKS